MALTLDATVGGAHANSYQDQTSAQAIIDTMPNADAWTAADGGIVVAGGKREQALVFATTLLEAMGWRGVKVGSQASQALAWPRNFVDDPDYGSVDGQWIGWVGATVYLSGTSMPRRLLRAHAALALEVLRAGTGDVWGVDDSINVKSERIGPIETTYTDPCDRRRGLRRFPQVWREIFPLLELSRPRTVERA